MLGSQPGESQGALGQHVELEAHTGGDQSSLASEIECPSPTENRLSCPPFTLAQPNPAAHSQSQGPEHLHTFA